MLAAGRSQKARAAFFAFLAWAFSFGVADASFFLFFPPLSFDAMRGLLAGFGQPVASCPNSLPRLQTISGIRRFTPPRAVYLRTTQLAADRQI
jgi:hypothetical protein